MNPKVAKLTFWHPGATIFLLELLTLIEAELTSRIVPRGTASIRNVLISLNKEF